MKLLKRFLASALALGMALSVSPAAHAKLSDQTLQQLLDKHRDIVGLTQEQRLEDYDYLWKTLEESWPFLGVTQRTGVDTKSIHDKYRKYIEDHDSDFALYLALNDINFTLGGQGHLLFFHPSTYNAYRDLYSQDLNLSISFQPWRDAIFDEGSMETYKCSEPVEDDFAKAFGYADAAEAEEEENLPNVETSILSPSTAYIKVRQMLVDRSDYSVINDFFESAEGCDNLIIDITENSGGSDGYWMNLLVAPLIDKPLSMNNICAFADTENNRPYLKDFFGSSPAKPISELSLPNVNRDDLKHLTHFYRKTITVGPRTSGEKAFDGKIWLLVGPEVYSASETFANFCKRTGFATLVGASTGGDGFGMDPVYCTLPNSRWIVRYSALYTMNADGRSNEEYGTSPDIPQRKDETALDACLRAIASGRAAA